MTGEAMVELEDVWRRYRVSSPKRPRMLRASITRDPLHRHGDRWLWALRGVDLHVHRGEAVGIIGRNGAGKSTLLRLVGDVGRPDQGTLRVRGRIGALVDLGHELHSDLTGRQNAEISGVIAGLSRREVHQRFDEITAFAELDEFIDEPLRAYSDGMRARLAFSVIAHLSPDVLIVDEALSVGDAAFQRRALERIRQLQSDGVAILLVSHDMALVRRVCDRAVWLDHGQVVASGRPQDVVAEYLGRTSDGPSAVPTAGPSRRRCLDAVRLLDEWSAPATSIVTGAGLIVEVDATLPPGDGSPLLQVRIVRSDADSLLVDTCTPLDRGRAHTVRLSLERLDLAPGAHRVEVAVYEPGWTAMVDEVEPLALEVRGPDAKTALLDPPHRWSRGGIRAEGDPSVDTAAPPPPH